MSFDDQHFALEVGPKQHPSLRRTTSVYRIIDFFSAAQLIGHGNLFVPLATRLSDANEGIDQSLMIQARDVEPCASTASYFRSKQDFIAHQELKKGFNYISCWTQQRESVAMWELYSGDHCSVQVATTIELLSGAFGALARNEYNPLELSFSNSEQRSTVISVDIIPVSYMSLINVGRRIDRRRRAYDKLERLGKIKSPMSISEWSSRDRERFHQYHFAPFTLKDESFSHEQEVRAVLQMAAIDRQVLDEIKVALAAEDWSLAVNDVALKNAKTYYARSIAQEQSRKRGLVLPQSIELSTPNGFVSSAAIDPRCPPHKRAFMEEFLKAHNVPIIESTCFGHAVNHIPIIPRAKLLQ